MFCYVINWKQLENEQIESDFLRNHTWKSPPRYVTCACSAQHHQQTPCAVHHITFDVSKNLASIYLFCFYVAHL